MDEKISSFKFFNFFPFLKGLWSLWGAFLCIKCTYLSSLRRLLLLELASQALNYNWKKSTAEKNNFPPKTTGMSLGIAKLLNIQRSSIKLLYAQLSKTKAFLLFVRPEVVEWGEAETEKEKKVKVFFVLSSNKNKLMGAAEKLEGKIKQAQTWASKLIIL